MFLRNIGIDLRNYRHQYPKQHQNKFSSSNKFTNTVIKLKRLCSFDHSVVTDIG